MEIILFTTVQNFNFGTGNLVDFMNILNDIH